MSDFADEQKKLNNKYRQQIDRLENYKEKYSTSMRTAWDLQMECFLKSNNECLEVYDKRFLEDHSRNRELIISSGKCFSGCEKISKNFNVSKKASNQNEIDLARNYFACAGSCIENTITGITTQLRNADKLIEELRQKLNKAV